MGRTMVSRTLLAALCALTGTNLTLAQSIADCTTHSFTTPSWFIDDFQSTASNASFNVLNRATNTSTEVSCQGAIGANGWSRCSVKGETKAEKPLQASLQLNGTNARVLINETWQCSDKTPDKPIVFSASGNNSLSLNCTGGNTTSTACNSTLTTPLLIKGSLLTPIQITPAYVEGPTGHDSLGCALPSDSSSWELGGLQYTRRTLQRAEGNVTTEILSLRTTNNATGYTTACGGFFTNKVGPQAMSCNAIGAGQPREKYRISTAAFFEPSSRTFTVNETWFCDGNNPAAPVSILASGSAKLPFDCVTNNLDNGGVNEETIFCSTETDTVTIPGSLVSKQAMPPYSLQDPLPTADSCTISSVLTPTWRLSDFETSSEAGAAGSLRFSIELQASAQPLQYPTNIVQNYVQLAANATPSWYLCAFEGDQILAPHKCTFRYDPGKKTLDLNADWTCSDLDNAHPVTFSGVSSTSVPDLSCTTEANTTSCTTTPGKRWSAKIESVSWTSSDQP